MPNNSKKEQIKGLTVWTVILIVVAVIVVGIVALSYILSRKSKQESSSPLPVAEIIPKPPEETQEPDTILLCVGTIKSINDSIIQIKTEKERNQFLEDRFFEVEVDDQTKILSQGQGPFVIKIGAEITTESLFQEQGEGEAQVLNLTDLKIGDSIMAISTENIKDKDSFVAREIYLLY